MSRAQRKHHARHAMRVSASGGVMRGVRRALGVVCALAMAVGPLTVPAAYADESAPQPADAGQTAVTQPRVAATDVTVVAFQQSWNTVAAECTNIYGPSGVKYVQISPPAESVIGTEWWTVYQPVSYRLESRFGTQAELERMIKTCNAAGVQVVADVELNNTTDSSVSWVDDQVGVAGTSYNGTYGRYPAFASADAAVESGLYRYKDNGNNHQYGIATKDFHDCSTNVKDFRDVEPESIWNCRQETRWDLNTSNERVQQIQADYLYRLWQLGVRGFRVSSAKFMNPADIAAIKAKLVGKIGAAEGSQLRFTQEVVYHQGEIAQIQADRYTRNGQVEEFRFAYDILAALNGNASRLRTLTDGFIDSSEATVFVANWNTVRGSETLAPESGARYELANAFMLANDYGEPMILSDYHFDNSTVDQEPQGTSDTRVPDVDMQAQCAASAGTASAAWAWGTWHCQPYWTSTRGMIEFHNAVHDAARTNWQQPSANNIGFARTEAGQDVGFFALNNTLVASEVTYQTSLPDGDYCNVYATSKRNCAAEHRIHVSDGELTTTIPARGAVAIYGGAQYDPAAADSAEADRGPVYGEETADLGRIADRTLTVYVPQSAVPAGGAGLSVRVTNANGAELRTVPLAAVEGRGGWLAANIGDGVNAQAVRVSVVNASGESVLPAAWQGQQWYSLGVGATLAWIDAQGAHMGTPFATGGEQKTRFTVHVPNDAFADARGVDVLGDGGQPEQYCALGTVSGASDRRVTCELSGIRSSVRFRVVAGEGAAAAVGGTQPVYEAKAVDRVVGSIEAWIDSTGELAQSSPEVREPSATPQPNDQKNPQQLQVTVHYYRPDGNYQEYDLVSDVWYGWDLWTWASETDSGGMQRFTGHDAFGEIAQYTLTQNQQGIRKPEFIVRQGGDAWMSKDPDDNDRQLPESAIVVEPGQRAVGTAEIWLVAGDPTIYTVEPQVVAVAFDTQGGSRVPAQAVVRGGTPSVPGAGAPSVREGYVFTGWSKDAAGQEPFDFGAAVTEPTTVYAQWAPAVTVSFAAGYEPVAEQTVSVPEPVVIAAGGSVPITQTMEREGYEFAGWKTRGGTVLAVGDELSSVQADTTLTAQWTPKSYTVVFDANGGVFAGSSGGMIDPGDAGGGAGIGGGGGAPGQTVRVAHGETVSEPKPGPVRRPDDGKTFVGWTTEQDGTVSYDFTRPVTGAFTLYAKWAESGETFHKVTLHYHDGEPVGSGTTGDGSSGGAVSTVLAKAGEQLELAADPPARAGYRFDGWTSTDGGPKLEQLPVVTGDLDLHARWVRVWTVVFCEPSASKEPCVGSDGAAAGESRVIETQSIDEGKVAQQPSPLPERAGYKLLGWSREQDGTATNAGSADKLVNLAGTPVVGDMQLYAVWQQAGPQWTIHFDLNGGMAKSAIDDVRVFDGEHLRNPVMGEEQKPTRKGYEFQGWSTVKNDVLCLSVFGFDEHGNSLIPIDRNGTLYAVWTPVAVRQPTA